MLQFRMAAILCYEEKPHLWKHSGAMWTEKVPELSDLHHQFGGQQRPVEVSPDQHFDTSVNFY